MPDFEDPAVSGAINDSEAWAHRNCGFQNVDLTAADHRFDGVPATLKAGTTSFALTNRGAPDSFVVALVLRPKDQTLTAAALQAMPAEQLFGAADVAPAAAAAPGGSTGGAIVELSPGHWFVVNPFGAEGAPSPYQSGMLAEFRVN